jgi:hypothetical protein
MTLSDSGPPMPVGEIDVSDLEVARSLTTVTFFFRVAIAGYDAAYPMRDMAHRQACVQIFQLVAQQVQAFAPGQHRWPSAKWTNERKQGQFGRELVATLALDIPIVDSTCRTVKPVSGLLDHPTEKRPS